MTNDSSQYSEETVLFVAGVEQLRSWKSILKNGTNGLVTFVKQCSKKERDCGTPRVLARSEIFRLSLIQR